MESNEILSKSIKISPFPSTKKLPTFSDASTMNGINGGRLMFDPTNEMVLFKRKIAAKNIDKNV